MMPDYLPLCSFRQSLLPSPCRTCSWWFHSGKTPADQDESYERRHFWMSSVEAEWGSPGIMLLTDASPKEAAPPAPIAVIHYAPVTALPRLRDLPCGPLPSDAALIFCLWVDKEDDPTLERRLLQKALIQLRLQGSTTAYAYATADGGTGENDRCEFFSVSLLESCGFGHVCESDGLFLMRSDPGGLVSLLGRVMNTVKKTFATDPTPSPAAWTRRET